MDISMPVRLQATELEKEWMGGGMPPMIHEGRPAEWNQVIFGLVCALEEQYGDGPGALPRIQDRMSEYRRLASERFAKSGAEGEAYQDAAAQFYACKMCMYRRMLKMEPEGFLEAFRRAQIADRIIGERFGGFSGFLEAQAERAAGRPEEAAVLSSAADRYALHAEYRRTLEEIARRKAELEELPGYPLYRDTVREMESVRGRLQAEDGEGGQAEELRERLAALEEIFEGIRQEAETASAPVRSALKKAVFRKAELAGQLNTELPLVNPACEALLRRLEAEAAADSGKVM